MTATASTILAAPLNEVFAWHERPGALTRLLPPWQPIRVRREAADLRDGSAELLLPGRIRWVARHRDYDPPHRFVDELTSLPLRWRHDHRFRAVEEAVTEIVDTVDTAVPDRFVLPMLAYRHRVLAGDLAAHARCRARLEDPGRPLTVAVTGSSGLIGTALCAYLSTGGHRVIRLVRRAAAGPGERRWRPEEPGSIPDLLAGADALVHLAGASIAGRFTAEHKRMIRDSRIEPTLLLAELAAETPGVRAFVCASAIGYYGPNRGETVLDEQAERGEGFLADVVAEWERAAEAAAQAGLRTVLVRTGIVQTPRGGALRLQRPLFTAGLGGPLGERGAWLSWIGLDDLLDIYLRALADPTLFGPVNAVAPNPVRSAEYARTLGKVLRRPAVLAVPAFGPRLLLGRDGAREVALASQRVRPGRLLAGGHRFRHPSLRSALAHQLGRADPVKPDPSTTR